MNQRQLDAFTKYAKDIIIANERIEKVKSRIHAEAIARQKDIELIRDMEADERTHRLTHIFEDETDHLTNLDMNKLTDVHHIINDCLSNPDMTSNPHICAVLLNIAYP